MKKILFATSEAVPFIKTGGLADVAGSLPKCFDKKYFDIRVILPKYACMKQEWKDKMEYVTHFIWILDSRTAMWESCRCSMMGSSSTSLTMNIISAVRNHMTAHRGILRNLLSFPKLCYQFFR